MNARVATILVVEDDQRLAALLGDYLLAAGYHVTLLHDGGKVVDSIRTQMPDLLVLDIMLPQRDGWELCREIRTFSSLPIIMTTARVAERDRLMGLELGADDYLCKPYSLREAVARVKAVLRRVGTASAAAGVASAALQLDRNRFEASLDGKVLPLTPVEFRLLCALHTAKGGVCQRQTLMPLLYADHRIVSDRTIDSHIKNLRRKLVDARPQSDPIKAIYGIGYKLILDGAGGDALAPRDDCF